MSYRVRFLLAVGMWDPQNLQKMRLSYLHRHLRGASSVSALFDNSYGASFRQVLANELCLLCSLIGFVQNKFNYVYGHSVYSNYKLSRIYINIAATI